MLNVIIIVIIIINHFYEKKALTLQLSTVKKLKP